LRKLTLDVTAEKKIGVLLRRGKPGLRNVVQDGTATWADRKQNYQRGR